MLINSPDVVAQEMLDRISYPITLQDFITNILAFYPVELEGFKIIKKDNGIEVLNFPFNPSIVPLAFMIQEVMNSATNQQNKTNQFNQQIRENKNFNNIPIYVNNSLSKAMMDILYKNREAIEGETGISLEDFLNKECKFIRKQNNGSVILTDAQGNVKGDIIEIGIEL